MTKFSYRLGCPTSILFGRLAFSFSKKFGGIYFQSSVLEVGCICYFSQSKQSHFLKTAHYFRPTVLRCLLTVDGWTETPVDVS